MEKNQLVTFVVKSFSKGTYTQQNYIMTFLFFQSKQKAEKNRQRVAESFSKASHAQRAEAAQARKEEKMRAEKERIMKEDDPETQKRLEVDFAMCIQSLEPVKDVQIKLMDRSVTYFNISNLHFAYLLSQLKTL